ncbi:endoribonuclease Dicer homolog 1 [Elysia marginata]|uniref:Endoribonuclease Dicer homolog 1 n=1 Tax=Elysia marginata TaxID=1093978 RepID=A0AAV4FV93_9GAST|nr:endoribonuclease Dicer homolog 1 [Elysia marginata]
MFTPTGNENFTLAQASTLNDLRTLNSEEEGRLNDIFTLRNGTGRCFLCKVDFTSDKNANDHLSGSKHKKNLTNHQRLLNGPEAAVYAPRQHNGIVYAPSRPSPPCVVDAFNNMTLPHRYGQNSSPGVGENPLLQPATPNRGPNGEEFTMNGSKGFCFVCSIQLTSFEHKESHVKGQKHQKRCLQTGMSGGQSQQNAVSSNPGNSSPSVYDILSNTNGVLMCSLCDVPFSCLANAREHFASNKHKKKVAMKSKENMAPCFQEPIMRQESVASSFDQTIPKAVAITDSPFAPLRNPSVERQTSGSVLSSQAPFVSAPVGAAPAPLFHPVPLRAVPEPHNPGPDIAPGNAMPKEINTSKTVGIVNGNLSLNVAEVHLTSTPLADQHLNGQKHKRKAATWKCALHDQVMLTPLASSTPCPGFEGQRASPPGVSQGPVMPQFATTANSPVQEVQDETCFFNPNSARGFCVPCGIEISSLQHYNQHRLGKPHSRSRQRYLLSQQGKSYPLECDVCKKSFTGQESAQQHFTSARHKSKVEIMGQGGREVELLEDGRMIMRDSQIWYVCDICECPLNTREQFEIHKTSPRHKKALESKLSKAKLEASVTNEYRNVGVEPHIADSGRAANDDAFKPTRSPEPQALCENERREQEGILESNLQHLLFKPHSVTNSLSMQGDQQWHFDQVTNNPGGIANTATLPQPNIARDTQSFLPTERYRVGAGAWTNTTAFQQAPQPAGNSSQQASNFHPLHGGRIYYTGSTASTSGHIDNTGSPGHCNANFQRSEDNTENRGSLSSHATSTPNLEMASEADYTGIARRPVMKRGTSNKSAGLPFRDIRTMEQRLSDDEEWNESSQDADQEVERTNFNISEEEGTGLASNLQNLQVSDNQQTNSFVERSTKPGFKYFCTVCKKHMNTKDSWLAHQAGSLHKFNVSTIPTPGRQLSPIRSVVTEGIIRRASNLTKDLPRAYQLELLQKAMAKDTVIYLPTGTGKTLVAVLTIGLMLEENKTRPILFLVDKVLLVLQQEKYIREQLKGKKFTRPDVYKENCMTERELLVMVICGGLFSKRDVPIWKHDIIVTTADFCINMLDRGWIHWNDFSLVVLDEVHHCHKNHPYLRLFASYHKTPQQHHPTSEGNQGRHNRRHPKVLGLSASPASKDTVEQTRNMLRNLLANLGGAHIAMVEEEVHELDRYQSSAKVKPICVPMSNNEREFTLHLLEYALMCYVQLAHLCPTLSNFKAAPYSYFAQAVQGTEEDITSTAENLMRDMEPLIDITTSIFMVQSPPEIHEDPDRKYLFDSLKMHLQALLLLVSDIGSNSNFVTSNLLKELEPSEKVKLFEKHSLPCSDMYRKVEHFASYGSKDMTMYNKLLETLSNPSFVDWTDRTCKALVLIQKRHEAKQLAHMLRDAEFVRAKQLQVSHLVGHGKGAQDGGMDVKKQKKLLDNQDRFHLLVATSIMEEGIDFQTLQLVVCMNPPTSVRALVQIRGRARRAGSHFVILCKTEEEKQKLQALLNQESNMAEAARLCLREDREGLH